MLHQPRSCPTPPTPSTQDSIPPFQILGSEVKIQFHQKSRPISLYLTIVYNRFFIFWGQRSKSNFLEDSASKIIPPPALLPLSFFYAQLAPSLLRHYLRDNLSNLHPRISYLWRNRPSPLSFPVPSPHPITFPQYRDSAHAHRCLSSRLVRLARQSSSSWNRSRSRHCPHLSQRAKTSHPLGPPPVPPPSRSRLFPRNHAHSFFSYPFLTSPQHRFLPSSSSSFRTPTRHDPLP